MLLNSKYFILFILGVSTSLIFEPINLFGIQLLSISYLYFLLQDKNTKLKETIIYSLLFYCPFLFFSYQIYFSIDTPKTEEYSFVFVFLYFYFSLLFLISIAIFYKLKNSKLNFLLFPILLFLFDILRSTFLIPTMSFSFGSSLINTPFSYLASIVGEFGLTFLLVLACTLFIEIIFLNKRPISLVLFFVLISALSFPQWTNPISEKISVSILQPNITDQEKVSKPREVISYLSNQIKQSSSDFIFIPEAAYPVSLDQLGFEFDALDFHLKKEKQNLIAGSSTLVNVTPRQEYSSLVGLGYSYGIYHKEIPIPFVESWPNNIFFDYLNLTPLSFSLAYKGDQVGIHSYYNEKKFNISSNVCYEVLIPSFFSKNSENSNLLFVASNTYTLGYGLLQEHLFVSSRFRAIENGKYLILSNNSGISAVINYYGDVVKRTELNSNTVLKSEFEFREGKTLFNILGDIPLLLLSFFIILFLIIKKHQE